MKNANQYKQRKLMMLLSIVDKTTKLAYSTIQQQLETEDTQSTTFQADVLEDPLLLVNLLQVSGFKVKVDCTSLNSNLYVSY